MYIPKKKAKNRANEKKENFFMFLESDVIASYLSDLTRFQHRMKLQPWGTSLYLENPLLRFAIEKANSNGSLKTRAKSRLETMKFFFVKQQTRRDREKCAFKVLKTDTSNGCKAWVVCGGRQRRIT